MADKIPLKGLFDGSGNVTGLAEYRSADGDTLGVIHGGTGLATIGANRIVTGNGTSAMTAESNLTFDGSTLAVTGNTTISGNLTVSGTVDSRTQITSYDPVMILNAGASGTVTDDAGLVFERGSAANVAIYWDESEDYFEFATTTDIGADAIGSSAIDSTGQAAIKVGNITSTGNITLTGNLQFDSGQTVNEISDDTTLADGAATALVTENAIKTHVSAQASAFAIALG